MTGAGPAGVTGSELPDGIAAAWGVRERPHKGPKPALSLPRIVDAAVQVADADGLDAVSMGRVARELGAAPMSLYRHVSGKEELLDLMVDAAWGDPPGAPAAGEDWRTGLARWAWALRARARRHPWAVRIPLNGLPVMPHEVAWFENALACLRETALTEARKGSVVLLLAGVRQEPGCDGRGYRSRDRGVRPGPQRVDGLVLGDAEAASRSAEVPLPHRIHLGRGLRRGRRPGRRVRLRPGPDPRRRGQADPRGLAEREQRLLE